MFDGLVKNVDVSHRKRQTYWEIVSVWAELVRVGAYHRNAWQQDIVSSELSICGLSSHDIINN